MFKLKSIYFYFLAIQISLIKFLKKIYFSTSYYNKSLISKTPQQFYFHPNPFLLSFITNYKKYSFKIREIDPNILWVKHKNTRGLKELVNKKNLKTEIEIDGGINFENCTEAKKAGANVLVSGSTIFKENQGDLKKNIGILRTN